MTEFIGKIIFTGIITLKTGMYIGTGSAGGIGLVDNPVIRDPFTEEPIIPGSSLKGKLRSCLGSLLNENADIKTDLDKEHDSVKRLFGSSPTKNQTDNNKYSHGKSRLTVRDCRINNDSLLNLRKKNLDGLFVEIKTENIIDRSTGSAEHPRQTERVPAGVEFDFEFIYDIYSKDNSDNSLDKIIDDLQNIKRAISFLHYESIGGSGSRGYGHVGMKVVNTNLISKSQLLGNDVKNDSKDPFLIKLNEEIEKNFPQKAPLTEKCQA